MRKRANGKASRKGARGFTLVEMLVTLALMAMISTLLWQAMQQVLRVEQLLQRAGVDGQLEVVRREWMRGLIQASLVEQTGAPRQFQGDGRQLTVASAEALGLPGLHSVRLQIRLDTDPGSGRQRLLVAEAPAADAFAQDGLRAAAEPIEVLSWQGQPGAIHYLDASGQWFDQWPPPPSVLLTAATGEDDAMRVANAAVPRLPRAVWLDLGRDVGGGLVASLSVNEPGRLSRAQWERQ